ncbi:MAG: hypothetical protein EHM33_02060 [Chloroflexi bacterium]|nr:MAG: hypothetical protein EHM33_02060 [Chloroflexota bacterium]
MRPIRIQRKRKSNAQMMIAWGGFLTLLFRWMMRPYIDQEKTIIQEAVLEVRRTQASVNYARRQQIESRIGIQDEQLRRLQLQNALLERQLKLLGGTADDFAPPSNY